MSEPATSAYTIAIGTVALTGTIFGMQADALLLGLFGGFVALRYAGPLTWRQLVGSLVCAAVAAGLFSPIAHAAAGEYLVWTRSAGDVVREAAAFAIGVAAQTAIPVGLKLLNRKGDAA